MEPAATPLEFLLVSDNHQTVVAVAGGLQQIGVRLNFSASSEGGREYIARHKVDGVVVDLDVPGAEALILFIRQSASNRNAAVFACLPRANISPAAVVPGASHILTRPLTPENVASQVSAVRNFMLGERRRFFRYRVSFPVDLRSDSGEQRGMMTSLGEGGMAVYALKPVGRFGLIEFEFDLPSGASIAGKGSIAWANDEGMLGIKFLFLRDRGEESLQNWCQQQVSP